MVKRLLAVLAVAAAVIVVIVLLNAGSSGNQTVRVENGQVITSP